MQNSTFSFPVQDGSLDKKVAKSHTHALKKKKDNTVMSKFIFTCAKYAENILNDTHVNV